MKKTTTTVTMTNKESYKDKHLARMNYKEYSLSANKKNQEQIPNSE